MDTTLSANVFAIIARLLSVMSEHSDTERWVNCLEAHIGINAASFINTTPVREK